MADGDRRKNGVYHFSLRWSAENTTENRETLLVWLRHKADKYIFQAEYTENEGKGNPHYQGYFHTALRFRAKGMAIAANDTLPGVEISESSTAGIETLKTYAMKQDSRVDGPWADRRIYLGADLWPLERMPAWQRQLLDVISKPPNDRDMIYVCDPVGNSGKTKFIKTLAYRYNALALGYGQATDILNLVSKFPGKNVYAWNLTRCKPANLSLDDLYAAIESIKDGLFVNLKYETAQILMDPPHCIVMSNHLPRYGSLSMDRWRVYLLVDGKLILQSNSTPAKRLTTKRKLEQ